MTFRRPAGWPEIPEREGRLRYSYDAQGRVLKCLRTGMVYVPYEQVKGGWYVVVVAADDAGTYQRGGYNLLVFDDCIETDLELTPTLVIA